MDLDINGPDLPTSETEALLGTHLIAEATVAAHFVAVAEAAGLSHDEINEHLVEIAAHTGLEFWVTDEKGRAYLRSRPEVQFRFNPDPAVQPQASGRGCPAFAWVVCLRRPAA